MRKLLLLLLTASAFATTTVTGNIKNLGVGNVGTASFVRFWLRGCGGNQPRISGSGVVAPSQGGVFFFDFPANSSGVISGTLYSTRDSTGLLGGDIECGGSKTSVWYGMQVFLNGKGGPEVAIVAKSGSTLDVSNVTPITTNPVVPAPTGDGTYLRLDAGNSPITGSVTMGVSLNQIRLVTSATTGADLGAKVNTADTALGSSAGEIWIDPSAGTTWTTASTFSGPRVIRFVGPGASYSIPLGSLTFPFASRIECGGHQHAGLYFNGSSGVAIKANWAQFGTTSFADWGYGIHDCAIIGPGTAAGGNGAAGTGIQVGDATHPTTGIELDNVLVAGFAVGISHNNVSAFGGKITHSVFLNNGTWSAGVQQTAANFVWNIAQAGGLENLKIDHTLFGQNFGASPVMANDFSIAGSSVIELTCDSCSFDNSQISVAGSTLNKIHFRSRHSEVLNNLTTVPLVISAGVVTDDTPNTVWDSATVSSSGVTVSAGTYSMHDGGWTSAISPVTQSILQSGTGNLMAINPTLANFSNNVGGITTGGSGYSYICDPTNAFCNFSITGGSIYGFNILKLFEGGAPAGAAATDVCFGSNTLHMFACNNNNQVSALPVGITANVSGTHSDSGIYQTSSASGCTTGATAGNACASPITVTWPSAYADTNYKVTCTPLGAPTNFPSAPYAVTLSTGNVTVNYIAITNAAASWPTINCEAVHN